MTRQTTTHNDKPSWGTLLGLLLGLVSPLSPAVAAPNGLTQIPIAKVFGNGVAAFSLNMTRLGVPDPVFGTVYTMQYGLFNRFETGFDYQAQPGSQADWLGNAKYLLVHEPGRLPDVACGIVNVAAHQKALPYLVGTTQPGAFGVSLGITGTGTTRYIAAMGGLAYSLSPRVQMVADVIEGRENYGTVGVIASLTPTTSINLAYARPNGAGLWSGSSREQGFVVNVAYTFHALHSQGQKDRKNEENKNPANTGQASGKG